MILNQWIDQLGDWNPQLFRELKGRLTVKSMALMFLVSMVGQSLVYMNFESSLPYSENSASHYCLGGSNVNLSSNYACSADAAGNVALNWPLWWAEIFLTLSLIGFFVLLLGGTYLLIQDLTKEQKQGTLNFVTLSPQSATAIALGKILGVPIWIYGCIACALPLHLWSGIRGGIPVYLILMFYVVTATCLLFFYGGALLFALVSGGGASKAWLGTGVLFYASGMTTLLIIHERIHLANVMDGVLLLNPIHMLVFLARSSPVTEKMYWFQSDSFGDMSFFGVPIVGGAAIATLSHLVIYGIGTYWFAQAFKRKFHNAHSTLITKKQSYILTILLTVFAVGFTVQEPYQYSSDYNNWLLNFTLVSICAIFYLLILIAALSPSYQSIQDWSRYHNHKPKEWIWGERSPAFWAIALNGLICFSGVAIAGMIVMEAPYRLPFFLGTVMQLLVVMLLAGIGQSMLLRKTKKRGRLATASVLAGIFLPLMVLAIEQTNPEFYAAPWFWTVTPLIAVKSASISTVIATIIGQTAAIAAMNQLIQQRIKRIGSSELRQLIDAQHQPTT
ncbi:MAG: hypothetical protein HC799_05350 [Limnothrix sp. RL_2_0]|nr:hypothetical protein [Limnothrix sp. RL_2_0]